MLYFYWSSYPTTWEKVSNKPYINGTDNTGFTWDQIGVSINGDLSLTLQSKNGKIYIQDSTTGSSNVELANYPIKWASISQKPSYLYTNENDISFGQYSTVSYDSSSAGYSGRIYPALRIYDFSESAGGTTYYVVSCYYFNGNSWTKITSNSSFIPRA